MNDDIRMIPIDLIQLTSSSEAASPSWLLAPTRHEGGPALRCRVGSVESIVTISGDRFAFAVQGARQDDTWIVASQVRIDADPAVIASPFNGDIPAGAICIIGDEPCLSARYGQEQVFVSLRSGEPVVGSYDRFVAFPHWRMTVAGVDDERYEIFNSALRVSDDSRQATSNEI